MHPAVSAAMIELLKAPLDIGTTGTASALRTGVIPGMDPLSDAIWKLKPDERKKRTLAFPLDQGRRDRGEDRHRDQRRRQDVRRVASVVLARAARASGARDHARILDGEGLEGSSARRARLDGRPGFAESGARNWVHSAATVLAFLQKERGLLQPGYAFRTILRDDAADAYATKKAKKIAVAGSCAFPDRWR